MHHILKYNLTLGPFVRQGVRAKDVTFQNVNEERFHLKSALMTIFVVYVLYYTWKAPTFFARVWTTEKSRQILINSCYFLMAFARK